VMTENEPIKYIGLWVDEKDIDDNTVGGGEAFQADDEQQAIRWAKELTESGRRCYVENSFGDEVWYPDYEEGGSEDEN